MVTIAEKKKVKLDISAHFLVPKHIKLSDKDREQLLNKYKITLEELPRISMKDGAIAHMDLTTDDVIRVERVSPTSNLSNFYRRVVK